MATAKYDHPQTPDGRYFVVRGRLWRLSNPALDSERREILVKRLMKARAALRTAEPDERTKVRARIDRAKRQLGERGKPWWQDGAPDYNRHLVKNTPYADWYARSASRRDRKPKKVP
jgi:hypothetical protein